jgi:DASS family divalent anion:Na+ symporter
MTIVIIVFLSVLVRYFFASGGAYVAAMVPVFATVGLVTGTAPVLLALAILFSNSYGGCITHYGGAAGPIIFASGYNDIKSWWTIGTVVALCTFLIHMFLGIPWWGFLMQHGMLQY